MEKELNDIEKSIQQSYEQQVNPPDQANYERLIDMMKYYQTGYNECMKIINNLMHAEIGKIIKTNKNEH